MGRANGGTLDFADIDRRGLPDLHDDTSALLFAAASKLLSRVIAKDYPEQEEWESFWSRARPELFVAHPGPDVAPTACPPFFSIAATALMVEEFDGSFDNGYLDYLRACSAILPGETVSEEVGETFHGDYVLALYDLLAQAPRDEPRADFAARVNSEAIGVFYSLVMLDAAARLVALSDAERRERILAGTDFAEFIDPSSSWPDEAGFQEILREALEFRLTDNHTDRARFAALLCATQWPEQTRELLHVRDGERPDLLADADGGISAGLELLNNQFPDLFPR